MLERLRHSWKGKREAGRRTEESTYVEVTMCETKHPPPNLTATPTLLDSNQVRLYLSLNQPSLSLATVELSCKGPEGLEKDSNPKKLEKDSNPKRSVIERYVWRKSVT